MNESFAATVRDALAGLNFFSIKITGTSYDI